jgi:hypothetical protein
VHEQRLARLQSSTLVQGEPAEVERVVQGGAGTEIVCRSITVVGSPWAVATQAPASMSPSASGIARSSCGRAPHARPVRPLPTLITMVFSKSVSLAV